MRFAHDLTRAPRAFDADLGREAADRFADHGPEVQAFLAGVAGCSGFLKRAMEKNSAWLNAALEQDPTDVLTAELHALIGTADPAGALRAAKSRLGLLIALADLGGLWTLEQVTQALTDLADRALAEALRASVDKEIARGKLPAARAPDAGLVAIAMGKLGAGELNYSSDIDLIMLYQGALYGDDLAEIRPALVRATRAMSQMLSAVTADGYVFRTDLRLRPDAAVTPVALSMEAAEAYYESVGRTWERAAFIKARAAAGDVQSGAAFLRRLDPFVWRRHLDFAAIRDAHDMRLRIRVHKGLHGPITLPGHDMKLGRGGIREIEFFTQTRQLIAGGRDPDLRLRGTVAGLAALAQKGWITGEVADALTQAYRAHREVEHRLQMIADAQTHTLPQDDTGFARLAAFMGQDSDTLRRDMQTRLELVHDLTDGFFAPADTARPAPRVSDPSAEIVRGWRRYPALRSERAVEIFERIKPDLLTQLSRAANPDEAIRAFDHFLSGLPAGVQLFSLFEANPLLVELIVDISATAPDLARYLGRNAAVFDAVIGGDFFAPWPGCGALSDALATALHTAPDYETALDTARRWHKEWHFRVGVHLLRGLMSAEEAGAAYANLAEASVCALFPPVCREFARKHGPPPGIGAAVIAMGSLGAGRLTATSDLDLIVIYDADGVDASDGQRPLAARQYYARLTQAFVTALTVPTAAGALYAVDMRLRPSGRQGPLATSLQSYRRYQKTEAWTWEHLALTRARPVAGHPKIGAAVAAIREDTLTQSRDTAAVLRDVEAVRQRLAAAAPDDGAALSKRGPGRLQDIELLAQTVALLSGAVGYAVQEQLTAGRNGGWLSAEQAETLHAAYAWYWRLTSIVRLLSAKDFSAASLGAGGQGVLLRQTDMASEDALQQEIARQSALAAAIVSEVLCATTEQEQ